MPRRSSCNRSSSQTKRSGNSSPVRSRSSSTYRASSRMWLSKVIPAQAGIQGPKQRVTLRWGRWIPAYAGMTLVLGMTLLLLLASCGFELRGDPEVGVRKLFISAVGPSNVQADIRRTLLAGGTRLGATPVEADGHPPNLQEEREKTNSPITRHGPAD